MVTLIAPNSLAGEHYGSFQLEIPCSGSIRILLAQFAHLVR